MLLDLDPPLQLTNVLLGLAENGKCSLGLGLIFRHERLVREAVLPGDPGVLEVVLDERTLVVHFVHYYLRDLVVEVSENPLQLLAFNHEAGQVLGVVSENVRQADLK